MTCISSSEGAGPGPSTLGWSMIDRLLTLFKRIQAHLYARLTRILLRVLAAGPIPRHVGFVMDGNRRYAKSKGWEVGRGHGEGFESLKRTLELCLRLGVQCVSVYAFAIDNFSRPENEVRTIMELAKRDLKSLASSGALLDEYDVRVNVLGRKELLPEDVRSAIEEVESLTRHHESAVLNVCCPYAAQDEIVTAIQRAALHSQMTHNPPPGAITATDIKSRLMTSQPDTDDNDARGDREGDPANTIDEVSRPLDILVRTSDVHRLSNFLLWQASRGCQLHFVKAYWPEFGIQHMLPILLRYQRSVWLGGYR